MTDLEVAADRAVLGPLRVVEIGSGLAGEIAGKVFAELGADVVKVEPPEGCSSRLLGPFVDGKADAEHSLHFWFYNVSKRSMTIDYRDPAGMDLLLRLLDRADICITTIPLDEARQWDLRPEVLQS